MFGLFTSTLSAFNQFAAFFGALICWGLGGLLVANAVYWRVHALRVQGEVIGVRRSGSHVFTVVGVALLGVGAAFFWIGATAFRSGPMTWVIALLLVAPALHKLWKVIAPIVTPKDQSLRQPGLREMLEILKAAQARQAQTGASAPAPPLQRVEDFASFPGVQVKVTRRRANPRLIAPVLLLAGLALVALGVGQSRALLRLEATGARAQGMVTALSSSSSGNGGVTYHPVVTFTDARGKAMTFRDSTGTNPPLYHVGQSVTVLYLPAEVRRAVIDRGAWNWLPSVLLYLLGGALFAAALAVLKTRSAVDADPLSPPGATP